MTTQYLTIFDGPSASIDNAAFSLEHLGRLESSLSAGRISAGNRFEVVIRGPLRPIRPRARSIWSRSIERDGLPNYFDDQRFGSVGYSGEFIAHAWLKGDAERALELALAEANPV